MWEELNYLHRIILEMCVQILWSDVAVSALYDAITKLT